jgi:tetratricopeptide (TPR) repeat protein
MGLVYSSRQNSPAALHHLKRAVDLKPSYAQAHQWLGMIWLATGRLEKARSHYRLAVELNPQLTTARTGLVVALLRQGAVDEAEAELGRFTQEQRQTSAFTDTKADVLYHAGQWARLNAMAKKQLERGDGFEGLHRFYLARIAVREGDTTTARTHLAKVRALEDPSQRHYWEGLIYATLGEPDSTLAAWRNVQDWSAPFLSWTFRHGYPDVLGSVREDPRYQALIEAFNQQWGLNPDGSIPEPSDTTITPGPEADA